MKEKRRDGREEEEERERKEEGAKRKRGRNHPVSRDPAQTTSALSSIQHTVRSVGIRTIE